MIMSQNVHPKQHWNGFRTQNPSKCFARTVSVFRFKLITMSMCTSLRRTAIKNVVDGEESELLYMFLHPQDCEGADHMLLTSQMFRMWFFQTGSLPEGIQQILKPFIFITGSFFTEPECCCWSCRPQHTPNQTGKLCRAFGKSPEMVQIVFRKLWLSC